MAQKKDTDLLNTDTQKFTSPQNKTLINSGGTKTSHSRRLPFLDYAKAVAITLMVIYHTSAAYPILGSFRMSTFLFIGGIFAKNKQTPFRNVLLKAIEQLLIPYFLLSIIAFTYCWISPVLHPEIYHTDGFSDIFKKAVVGIFLMQDKVTSYSFMPCGPLWFLPALFWCRIVFHFWLKMGNLKYKWVLRIILLAGLFLLYWYKVTIFSLSAAAVCFPLYLCGFYLKDFIKLRLSKTNKATIALFCSIFIAFIVFTDGNIISFGGGTFIGLKTVGYLRCLFGTLTIIGLMIFLEKIPPSKFKDAVGDLGSATIAVLGLHMAGIYLFKVVWTKIGYDPGNIPFIVAVPVGIIICAVCLVIYKKILVKYLPAAVGKSKIFKN